MNCFHITPNIKLARKVHYPRRRPSLVSLDGESLPKHETADSRVLDLERFREGTDQALSNGIFCKTID
jgi:hypothetical protein